MPQLGYLTLKIKDLSVPVEVSCLSADRLTFCLSYMPCTDLHFHEALTLNQSISVSNLTQQPDYCLRILPDNFFLFGF